MQILYASEYKLKCVCVCVCFRIFPSLQNVSWNPWKPNNHHLRSCDMISMILTNISQPTLSQWWTCHNPHQDTHRPFQLIIQLGDILHYGKTALWRMGSRQILKWNLLRELGKCWQKDVCGMKASASYLQLLMPSSAIMGLFKFKINSEIFCSAPCVGDQLHARSVCPWETAQTCRLTCMLWMGFEHTIVVCEQSSLTVLSHCDWQMTDFIFWMYKTEMSLWRCEKDWPGSESGTHWSTFGFHNSKEYLLLKEGHTI